MANVPPEIQEAYRRGYEDGLMVGRSAVREIVAAILEVSETKSGTERDVLETIGRSIAAGVANYDSRMGGNVA